MTLKWHKNDIKMLLILYLFHFILVIRVKLISEPTKGFKIFLKGFEDFEGQESLVNSLLRYLISLQYSRLYDCKRPFWGQMRSM